MMASFKKNNSWISFSNAASKLNSGLGELNQGMQSLAQQTPALSSGLEQLSQGQEQLAEGIAAAADGVATMRNEAGGQYNELMSSLAAMINWKRWLMTTSHLWITPTTRTAKFSSFSVQREYRWKNLKLNLCRRAEKIHVGDDHQLFPKIFN